MEKAVIFRNMEKMEKTKHFVKIDYRTVACVRGPVVDAKALCCFFFHSLVQRGTESKRNEEVVLCRAMRKNFTN